MSKNKIVLLNFLPAIDADYTNKGSIYPSAAIMLLGTILKKHGYSIYIIDGAYHQDYLEILKKQLIDDNVLYVGMSVMTTQVPFALEASKIVKQYNKNIPVIWGGAHPTLFPEQTLKNENIDIIAINEGTTAALCLAEQLQKEKDFKNIRGIGYKDGNTIVINSSANFDNIDELPYFNFSLINISNYLNSASNSVFQREFPLFGDKIKMMPMLTGLGCPYKCEFCINVIFKRKYRFRSAESIVEEIKRLQSDYDVNTFLFLDENFFANKKRVLQFISLVEKENLHFNWRVWCRPDHFRDSYINPELIKRLENIGYGSIAIGGESANQETLDALKKNTTPKQIMHSLDLLTKSDIFPRYSFMVGLENESIEQIKNTYKFCLNMRKNNPRVDIAGPFIFRLYPGSPIYNRLTAKYNLNIPNRLDLWEKYLKKETSFTYMPWAPRKFQKNIKLLVFYSTLVFHDDYSRTNYFKKALLLLLRKFSILRIRCFFFKFPFEYWLYRIRNKLHILKIRR